MCAVLGQTGLDCQAVSSIEHLCRSYRDSGAGALLVTEEAMTGANMTELERIIAEQPPWSDIPIMILTGAPSIEMKVHSFRELGPRANVTLVDRPVRTKTLVSAVSAVLRARMRQYDVRDLLSELESRVQERDRFLAILGHELRNPLGSILLATEMDQSGSGGLDREHVDVIRRQVKHLTRLVNDLLDLSRVTSGKISLKMQTLDLNEVIENCCNLAKKSASDRSLDLEVKKYREPVLVEADPVRVEQVVSNLITNAIKYTPEGGRIDVTVDRTDHRALIHVRDTGVGIARDRIDSIFELFAQAENSIGRAQGGMGIGLALVRTLVELHGGRVFATSDGVGSGSEFVVELPVNVEAKAPAPSQQKNRGTSVLERKSLSIVVVEDNPDLRQLLSLKLQRLGHDVATAADGKEGLELLLRCRPRAALVDIGLPGIDGLEVARRARGVLGDSVFLVALSGFGLPDDKKKAREAGFNAHLTKPAEVSDIERVLSRMDGARDDE